MNVKIRLAMKAIFGLTNCQNVKVTRTITPNGRYFKYKIEFYNKIKQNI
jgi:hypothetical protein